jgi:hypothetical protein
MSRNFLPEDIQQLQNAPAAPGWKAERYRANWLASLIIHTKRLANKIVSEITADHVEQVIKPLWPVLAGVEAGGRRCGMPERLGRRAVILANDQASAARRIGGANGVLLPANTSDP